MDFTDTCLMKSAPSEEDIFLFTEALGFLIAETQDPRFMLELGGYYYGEKDYVLAQKYYEMAAELGLTDACSGLGYIWYYGRTGKRDFEKAFHYYSIAAAAGDLQAEYKLADMYRNGYFVEKDEAKYRSVIESLYPKVKDARYLSEPLPEVFTRLARIRAEEGKKEEAVELYRRAKEFLAQRIRYTGFFGDLSIMMGLIDGLYALIPFDKENFDLYDLYRLLLSPCEVRFRRGGKRYTVSAVAEEGGIAVRFGDVWYRGREEFFKKALLDGKRLTFLEEELYLFEVT